MGLAYRLSWFCGPIRFKMFSLFNKNKTNSSVTTKNSTNDQLQEEDNINDPIIQSSIKSNKMNKIEHNCNDLGNIEAGPIRPILTVSE